MRTIERTTLISSSSQYKIGQKGEKSAHDTWSFLNFQVLSVLYT